MSKHFLLTLLILGIFSCHNSEPKIPGVYKNYETKAVIEIDCDYHISLPTNCCNSLPSKHGNKVKLSATGINKSEVVLSVMVDDVQWSFGIWDKHRSILVVDGETYERFEVQACIE